MQETAGRRPAFRGASVTDCCQADIRTGEFASLWRSASRRMTTQRRIAATAVNISRKGRRFDTRPACMAGVKVVRHARYVTFQTAEIAMPRRLFATILRRIRRLCPVPL